ncbi:pectinesterase family protein [Streptomyces sp. NBC_00481]|uniref:pectinesterase family protein n=1 Tax=unclassified Streptomyces TaxID=2593676 RepID=UPI002DD80E2D|nr:MULTISPECIES: pectinesterase family protein [unclassified Streptomyces]WRZ00361.1 pectinesterase family protein [Streptomyces sp. NBC_00481]
MTTEPQGHLGRRSFLTSAIAVAAGTMLAGGAVVAAAPSASAATGAHVTWHITSTPGTGADGAMRTYAATLNRIRAELRSHQVRPEGGRVVDVTDEDGTSQYIALDVYAEGRSEFVRVFMRRSDAYVMAFRTGTDNNGSVTWANNWYTLEAGVNLPAGIRGAGGAVDTRFQGLSNYTDLSRQQATRDNLHIGTSSLSNAVLQLGNAVTRDSNGNITATNTRPVAQSLLQIIVAFAEGARFRRQAADTAERFRYGQEVVINATHIAHHNNWGVISVALLAGIVAAEVALTPELEIGGIIFSTVAALAEAVMMAHHANRFTKGRGLLGSGVTKLVAPDGTGDHWTVQEAIDAAGTSGETTIFIDKGIYHEVISVPSSKSWLTIQGVTGKASDVVIYNTRCNGMINPATGKKWGTQGSAVATFRPSNLVVKNLRIVNTFDRNAHPEISPYETQAVAVVAMGDRQVYQNVEIWSHQDTLYVKGETPTTQARQYFVGCHIRGDVDFIFGNATAVIAHSAIQCLPWPNGTVLAPSTDDSKLYGILIASCTIKTDGVPNDTMHLGRPWVNTETAFPQALVRDCDIGPGINADSPWIDMIVGQTWWQYGRLFEYRNFGPGTSNAWPTMDDADAAEHTAQKYLAGSDGWDPTSRWW